MTLPYHGARGLIIIAFLVRGCFYCVVQPIWEGFDEWAHFGYIQHLAEYWHLPSRSHPVSDALHRSLELVPVSRSAAQSLPESITHDDFWRLPLEERLTREREFGELCHYHKGKSKDSQVLRQYEAQQPPLYYILLAIVFVVVRDASLPTQTLALRLASLLIAAVGLLLCLELASKTSASRRAAVAILLLLVSWPGLLIDVSRIGNDGLALTLASAFLLSLCRIIRGNTGFRAWVLAGVLLGAALLTKAYLLALAPLLPAAAVLKVLWSRRRLPRDAAGLTVAFVLAASIAGGWYFEAWRTTGTISGEQLDAAAARFGLSGKLVAVWDVQWGGVLHSAAATHIWTGGWSFLSVRSWMYRVFEWLAAVAAIGLIVLLVRLSRKVYHRGLRVGEACLSLSACAYLLFCLGLAYFSVVVYLTRGISTALGWYLYAIAGAEAVLLASGFAGLFGMRRAAGCVAAVAALACIFDLYAVHFVAVPYYTGLTAHLPSGALAAFYPASLQGIGIGGVLSRLAVNKSAVLTPSVLLVLWIAYLFTTCGLLVYSVKLIKGAFFPNRRNYPVCGGPQAEPARGAGLAASCHNGVEVR